MAKINKPGSPAIVDAQMSVDPVDGASLYRLYSVKSVDIDAAYYDGSYTITDDESDTGGTE